MFINSIAFLIIIIVVMFTGLAEATFLGLLFICIVRR